MRHFTSVMFVSCCVLSAAFGTACDSSPEANAAPPAGAGGSAGGSSEAFSLAWQDDFEALDPSLWQLMTHSWDSNLALFSTGNTSVADGILSIHLTPEPTDTVKPFRGVELRSVRTVTYGKVEARVRFARGSGVVSGLVLIYTPWPADDWNEIDIEHLGKASEAVQLNCQVYLGPPLTPPVTTSVTPARYEQIVPLGFDAEADFHVYTMEWTPSAVRFMVDGTLLRTWDMEIARMRLPQNILFTIWASSIASWAGPILPESAPSSAEIDWIKVYDWTGS